MKIERVTLYQLRLPLVRHFETSFGRVYERSTLIVRIDSGGLSGFGECPADAEPLYAGETVATCALALERYLVPLVLGRSFDSVAALVAGLERVRGNGFARAGLEAAFCDLLARSTGRTLSEMYGGTRTSVGVGVSIGIQDSLEELGDQIAGYLERGYQRIKVKVKPGWDLEVLRYVRERFAGIALMADANAAYSLDDTEHLREFDAFGLTMIEQPFHQADLVDHARLQAQIQTPVCLDESVVDLQHAAAAIELGAMRVLNIKMPRVGGPSEAIAIHDLCRSHDIPVWCGGLLESGIGRAHNLALASLPGYVLPGDLSESARYYEEDVIEPPVTLNGAGAIDLPTGPGLGFEVVESRLSHRAERELVMRP